MDADGEDRPEDILTLLKAAQNAKGCTAVFAERGKRLETPVFRAFYEAYRVAHHILTGRDIRFGNFSYVPWPFLETLTVFPELWNHYAATFIKSSLPYLRIRVDRAKRLTGRSQMKFVDLVVHGLSALFANQEVVGTRLLIMIFLSWLLLMLLVAAGTIFRFFAPFAIPGWAGIVAALLIVLASQVTIAAFVLFFSITMNRSQLGFLPVRDYGYFIRRETRLLSDDCPGVCWPRTGTIRARDSVEEILVITDPCACQRRCARGRSGRGAARTVPYGCGEQTARLCRCARG
jgi:hypothetical protein